ncbi:MAG TPA: hypothetical protein VFH42_05095 [Sporolactobacillaceae bacterium]|nr:hypothetical protein [Sporolactobacillaceae bacterium]
MDQKRHPSSRQHGRNKEEERVKIKSSVVSPPEPTPHPKDIDAIEY